MIRDRRATPRLESSPLVYLAVAPDNGGILLNLSDTGLALQAVAPLHSAQQVQFQMDLPGVKTQISTNAEIVWTDPSGKLAGARLLNLPPTSREHIRTWIASQKDLQATLVSDRVLVATDVEQGVTQRLSEAEGEPITANDSPSAAGGQDEIGHLRSAVLQFKTLEHQTESLASRVVAWGRNLHPNHRLIGGVMSAALAFAVVSGELIYYGRHGALSEIKEWFAASLKTFKNDALDGQDVPRWIARALNEGEPKSETSSPAANVLRKPTKHDHLKNSKRRSRSIAPLSASSSQSLMAASTPDETRVAAISPPPGFTSPFLVRGNNQLLRIQPARIPPLPDWNPSAAPANTSSDKATVRVFSEFTGRAPENYEPPSYPEVALQTKTEGSVVVQATVSKDGAVEDVNVLSGDSLLASAVTEAVKRWKYKPYLNDGKPIEGDIRVKVTFAISKQ